MSEAGAEDFARSHERCAWHPTRETIAFCFECGQALCLECHGADELGLATCPDCRGEDARAGQVRPVPLEDPSNTDPFVLRLAQTLKAQVVSPADYYARLAKSDALLTPFVAGYCCLALGLAMSYGYAMLLGGPAHEVLAKIAADVGTSVRTLELARLLGAPFEALFRIAVYTAVLHFAARIVGGAASLRKTFQIYAYSSVAALFFVIPVVGGIIVLAVQIMAQFAGLRVLHDLSPGRAALACAIPLTLALLGGGGAA
jgi:hypothetical protein